MLKKLVDYAAYMFGANVITGLITFGVTAMGMVTRPKEAFGDYALYMTIYQVGQGLFIYGANAAIQRYSADDPENRRSYCVLSIQSFLLLLAVFTVVGVVVGATVGWRWALALLGLPWLVVWWWGRYLVRSALDAKREARLMMVMSLSNSGLQALFLTATDWRDALIYGDFLALVVSGAVATFYVRAASGLTFSALVRAPLPRALLETSIRFAAPMWWSGQIYHAQVQVQGIWTAARLGAAPLGALAGKETFWQFASKPLEYLGSAALPGLVSARTGRSALYRDLLRLCLVAFTVVGIAVATGIPLVFELIDQVSSALGRDGEPLALKYREVPMLLRVSAVVMPIVAFEIVTNNYAVAEGKGRVVLHANVATVVTVLATLYPLASHLGLVGVVVSGVAGSLVKAVTYLALLWRELRDDMRVASSWTLATAACAVLAMVPAELGQALPWSWALAVPASIIFFVGVIALRVVGIADLERAFGAYRARRGVA
ncbi:hypothetical protein L6R52_30305 [Myxococcota bacterium]|nr:hypothetical protein [Myxococcota bacterium]